MPATSNRYSKEQFLLVESPIGSAPKAFPAPLPDHKSTDQDPYTIPPPAMELTMGLGARVVFCLPEDSVPNKWAWFPGTVVHWNGKHARVRYGCGSFRSIRYPGVNQGMLDIEKSDRLLNMHTVRSLRSEDIPLILLSSGASAGAASSGPKPVVKRQRSVSIITQKDLLDIVARLDRGDLDIADTAVVNENGDSALIVASREGLLTAVRSLLRHRAVINQHSFKHSSALTAAAMRGHHDVVSQLLTSRADPNNETSSGDTPLSLAVWKGHSKTAMSLLKAGAKCKREDRFGDTVLLDACKKGMTELVRVFLGEKGMDVNHQNKKGETPLMTALAVSKPSRVLLNLLIQNRADVNLTDRKGRTALDHATSPGAVEILQSAGAKNGSDEGVRAAAAAAVTPMPSAPVAMGDSVGDRKSPKQGQPPAGLCVGARALIRSFGTNNEPCLLESRIVRVWSVVEKGGRGAGSGSPDGKASAGPSVTPREETPSGKEKCWKFTVSSIPSKERRTYTFSENPTDYVIPPVGPHALDMCVGATVVGVFHDASTVGLWAWYEGEVLAWDGKSARVKYRDGVTHESNFPGSNAGLLDITKSETLLKSETIKALDPEHIPLIVLRGPTEAPPKGLKIGMRALVRSKGRDGNMCFLEGRLVSCARSRPSPAPAPYSISIEMIPRLQGAKAFPYDPAAQRDPVKRLTQNGYLIPPLDPPKMGVGASVLGCMYDEKACAAGWAWYLGKVVSWNSGIAKVRYSDGTTHDTDYPGKNQYLLDPAQSENKLNVDRIRWMDPRVIPLIIVRGCDEKGELSPLSPASAPAPRRAPASPSELSCPGTVLRVDSASSLCNIQLRLPNNRRLEETVGLYTCYKTPKPAKGHEIKITYIQQGYIDIKAVEYVGNGTAAAAAAAPKASQTPQNWACVSCTYHNNPRSTKCAMCGSARTVKKKAPESKAPEAKKSVVAAATSASTSETKKPVVIAAGPASVPDAKRAATPATNEQDAKKSAPLRPPAKMAAGPSAQTISVDERAAADSDEEFANYTPSNSSAPSEPPDVDADLSHNEYVDVDEDEEDQSGRSSGAEAGQPSPEKVSRSIPMASPRFSRTISAPERKRPSSFDQPSLSRGRSDGHVDSDDGKTMDWEQFKTLDSKGVIGWFRGVAPKHNIKSDTIDKLEEADLGGVDMAELYENKEIQDVLSTKGPVMRVRRALSTELEQAKGAPGEAKVVPAAPPGRLGSIIVYDAKDVEIDRQTELGTGNFGVTCLGYVKSLKKKVAVKVPKKDGDLDENDLRECLAMSALKKHPNIVEFIGVATVQKKACLIMGLCERGSLKDNLRELKFDQDPAGFFRMARGIAKGIAYLHGLAKPIVHRDIAARNVLVKHDWTPLICDYGLSHRLKSKDGAYMRQETWAAFRWSAPESQGVKGKFFTKSDVWMFGVTLWEMLTRGGTPYSTCENQDPNVISRAIRAGEIELKAPENVVKSNPAGVGILNACLTFKHEDRPEANRVVKMIEEAEAGVVRQSAGEQDDTTGESEPADGKSEVSAAKSDASAATPSSDTS